MVMQDIFLFSDTVEGNIAYWQAGFVPIRPGGWHIGRLPWTGDGSQEWLANWRVLPHAVNPPQGYLANWNNKAAADFDNGDAVLLGKQDRVSDIADLLAADAQMTVDDLLARPIVTDLLGLEDEEMRRIRGKSISMIFQEPMTSLNPVFRIGDQIAEALELHEGLTAHDARDRAVEMLRLVGIPAPEMRAREYPHQMSGGMRQRVMIAMALANNPDLLIADEPTTALDVTVQAQILKLLKDLQRETGMALLLITHDLGIVRHMADHVVVMRHGRIVEAGQERENGPGVVGVLGDRAHGPLLPATGRAKAPTAHDRPARTEYRE